MSPEVDLESAAYVLYVAQREVDSIPYTAPEALVDRMRQVVPLGQELLDEIRRLRADGPVFPSPTESARRAAEIIQKPTTRELAAVARKAAEIIILRGKATGTYEDDLGRVDAFGALFAARAALGYSVSYMPIPIVRRCPAFSAFEPLTFLEWCDLPTTTEQEIAKVFLRIADETEAGT
jgi:hypothetical protein